MRAEVREAGGLRRAIEIHLEVAEVKEFIDRLVDAYRRRYAIPGFRPGKAPANLVQGRFQDEIEKAIYDELVPHKIEEALAQNDLRPASPGKLSNLRYRPNEPLSFSVELEVWPRIDLKSYEGLEVDQLVEEVSDAEVTHFLDALRERMAEVNPVDRAAGAGDLVDVQLEQIDDASTAPVKEAATIEVGAPNLLPEFQAAVEGAEAGQQRELSVTYPEDFGNEELRGETRRYRMTVEQIREKKLPALDDELARRLESELDLEGLRAKVRLRLESEKRLAARERLEQTIVDRLIRENPFDLPQASVQSSMERFAQRQRDEGQEIDPAELEQVYRPHIERAHRRELVLIKVAEREQIEVGQDEVEAEIARMARQENRQPDEVREQIADLDRFRDFLFERRVFEALAGKVKVREVSVPSRMSGPHGEHIHVGSAGKESTDE